MDKALKVIWDILIKSLHMQFTVHTGQYVQLYNPQWCVLTLALPPLSALIVTV